jgi:CheY-like chemotaxis protein
MSRIAQGRIELQREPFELGSALAMAIESVQPLLKERHHELVHTASPRPLYVEGDLARIVQSFSNVLSNAAKYTEPGGHLGVAVSADDRSAVVEVGDDGAGISAEMLPKVFELFVQADRTLDRAQGGLGIGLSVVRRMVEMHGGEITATSAGLGQGSTFRIRLPLVAAPAAAESDSEAVATKPVRVLVVDDNHDAADSLAELLTLDGHVTETVYGPREALERAAEFAADVVLLDIGLPEMDGYEVARRLRAAGRTALLVALTGYGQADDVRRAREAGFDEHLTKPVVLADLERILRERG